MSEEEEVAVVVGWLEAGVWWVVGLDSKAVCISRNLAVSCSISLIRLRIASTSDSFMEVVG